MVRTNVVNTVHARTMAETVGIRGCYYRVVAWNWSVLQHLFTFYTRGDNAMEENQNGFRSADDVVEVEVTENNRLPETAVNTDEVKNLVAQCVAANAVYTARAKDLCHLIHALEERLVKEMPEQSQRTDYILTHVGIGKGSLSMFRSSYATLQIIKKADRVELVSITPLRPLGVKAIKTDDQLIEIYDKAWDMAGAGGQEGREPTLEIMKEAVKIVLGSNKKVKKPCKDCLAKDEAREIMALELKNLQAEAATMTDALMQKGDLDTLVDLNKFTPQESLVLFNEELLLQRIDALELEKDSSYTRPKHWVPSHPAFDKYKRHEAFEKAGIALSPGVDLSLFPAVTGDEAASYTSAGDPWEIVPRGPDGICRRSAVPEYAVPIVVGAKPALKPGSVFGAFEIIEKASSLPKDQGGHGRMMVRCVHCGEDTIRANRSINLNSKCKNDSCSGVNKMGEK